MATSVGVLLYDGIETLDFCGPYEVFTVTRLNPAQRTEASPFMVQLIAEKTEIQTAAGMRLLADVLLEKAPAFDILVIPGGQGSRREMKNPALLAWLKRQTPQLWTSVCTGSLILGAAGLLDGYRATTHWAALSALKEVSAQIDVIADEHVVEDRNRFTSAGISAGIDMALKVVARICGAEVALATARHMEYDFRPDNNRRVATLSA